ncbi:unnamed protein product [Parascedosporium putredinis]|uniref:Uncharacterized protein n=1 Tax=Parascedosporium putredinis TaxID=1442378 RepID=A0A9P1M7D1_9PEZI|nr:unnamed protein product [Parascedosporium putredinis]CAI7991406.1 unnamed protein product [Parascedosporium putredinis]
MRVEKREKRVKWAPVFAADSSVLGADIGHGGSLGLTERWQGFAIRDVTEWSSEAPRTIHITLGICPTPLALQVRKFKPSPGDITFRSWRDGNVEKRVELAPYALVNVRQTALKFHEYLNLNTMKTLEMAIRDTNHDDLVLETLQWAKRQCQNLKPDEWQFLVDALRLWVAIRLLAPQKGYSLPQFVEELQFGANVLLAYWHYYRTDEDPLEVDCLDRHRSRLMDLTAEQFTFIQKSCKKLRETRELFRDMTNWDDPLYWVCRMFDQKWEGLRFAKLDVLIQ